MHSAMPVDTPEKPERPIDPHELGERIAEARKAVKLNRRELEERIGLSEGALGKIERGDRVPLLATIVTIADALKIPVSWLLDTKRKTSKTHLPGLRPYLRTKYSELSPEAIEELDRHFLYLAEKHGVTGVGPKPGEDEFDNI